MIKSVSVFLWPFFCTFLIFLYFFLEFLAINACCDHALFAAICGPPKSDCGKFVSFLMSGTGVGDDGIFKELINYFMKLTLDREERRKQ